MAMAQLGQPYTAVFRLRDANGAPVTSGVTGTATLYGPGSVAPLLTGIGLTHQGDGLWGATIAGSNLTAPGLYRLVAASLTYGTTTLTDAATLWTVGEVPPDYRTLRALLTSIYTALRDGLAGTATAGSATTLADSALSGAGVQDGDWNGSELLILGPTRPTVNPQRVSGFIGSSGTLTLAVGGLTTGTAYDYLLINRQGAGWRYARVLDALRATIDGVRRRERVTDQVALTTVWGQREYPLPAGWRDVTAVQVGDELGTGGWGEVAPGYWDFDAQRRVLIDTYGIFPGGRALRLSGTIDVPPPATLGSIVPLPWAWVRDATLAELLVSSDNPADQRRAAVLFNTTQRARPRQIGG